MATVYRNVAVWLRVGLGANSIIYAPHGGGAPQFAAWTPASSTLPEFGIQLGGPNSPAAGTLVGETYSRDLFVEGIREGLFPLDRGYVPTDHDDDLMKLVSINGLPAYQALVLPALKMAGITTNPGPVAPNAPAGLGGQPAIPPTPPPPVPAPVPTAPAPSPALPIPTLSPPLASATLASGGLTPEERAALVQLVEGRFPGDGEKVASVVDLALTKNRKPIDIAKALLPLLGVQDPRVLAFLDLAAAFE